MQINNKTAKAIIRKYRAGQKHKFDTPLIHLIINIRSYAHSSENKRLKAITMQRHLCREYQIKNEIISQYKGNCFQCEFSRFHYGEKTYCKDGMFYVRDPELGNLPF